VRRLQTLGLLLTLLVVLALGASAIFGLMSGGAAEGVPGPDAEPEEVVIDAARPRVEVLNGSGVAGLARTATRVLRERGFDVVFFGNAPGGARDTSVVIDRAGRPGEAQRVADALGIEQVRSEPDTSLYLEATVIVGRDWTRGVQGGATQPPAAP
jgi:hypothetical protein